MQVVDLNRCRSLLGAWDEFRRQIVQGQVSAFAVCMRDAEGRETVGFFGDYRASPEEAMKAAARLSWEMTKDADEKEELSAPAIMRKVP